MKFTLGVCAAAALVDAVVAFPSYSGLLEARQDPSGHPWQAPPPGSVRAPCPGLNTMANHGYINRNGFCITKQAMQQGFLDAFNMGFLATNAGGDNAIALCGRNKGTTCNCFDLSDMNTPHQIEHDASLSRRDKEMFHDTNADNSHFNQTIWNRSLMIYGNAGHIGVKFANTARIKRVQQAQGADFPGWFRENSGGSLAEHSFILSTMNDPAAGVDISTGQAAARVDWLNYWLVNQRLPLALGWTRPTNTITQNDLTALVNNIANAPTVSVFPGNSPYLRPNSKRDLLTAEEAAPPTTSYQYAERDLEDLEARGILTVRAVPTPLVDIKGTKISAALVQASALAGPPPAIPNAYTQVLTSDEWAALANASEDYTVKIQSYVSDILGTTVSSPPSTS